MLATIVLASIAMWAEGASRISPSGVLISRKDVRCIAEHLNSYLSYAKPIIVYYEGDCPKLPDASDFGAVNATDQSGMDITRSNKSVHIFTKTEITCLVSQYRREPKGNSSMARFQFQPTKCPKR